MRGQVTATPGQSKRESMASDSNSRSLLEPPARQFIRDLAKEWLMGWLPPSQREEADVARVEINLGTDQPVRPRHIDLEAVAQHLHGPLLAGAPQEDDPAAGMGLQVQPPTRGEGTTPRSRLDPRGRTQAAGGDELARLGLQTLQGLVGEPGPDLGLPTTVEVLDGRP